MKKNLFIAFEGIDGSGKDTQLHKLVDYIKEDNNSLGDKYSNIWITRQPTKITPAGVEISNAIRERDVSGEEASKLFVEDRIEHSKMIRSFLSHSFVLTSRCDVSTLLYQMTQGIPFETLYEMHKYGDEGTLIPDLTIIFDIPAEVAFERTSSRQSKEECFEKIEFQKNLIENQNYVIEELRKRDKRKIIVVNANQSIEKVTEEMVEKIKKELK